MNVLGYCESKIIKVISGGQTGADQAGLEAGRLLGLETGGTAPKGYRTESGDSPELRDKYNLLEHSSREYGPRTIQNVKDSDFTIVLGNEHSPGCKLTLDSCRRFGKPSWVINDFSGSNLTLFAAHDKIEELADDKIILNVAGNRESKNPGIYNKSLEFLVRLIQLVNAYDL